MEAEVDELFRESYKMLKSFQQKQKKADQEQDKMAASGRRRSRQDDQSKQENPAVLMCSRVLDQIKEFKVIHVPIYASLLACQTCLFRESIHGLWGSFQQEHIPMVTILCNPGVRERHWKQMSEIVEYDLTPDSGTTLCKVLTLNLTPYLEQFESISGSASKVREPDFIYMSNKMVVLQYYYMTI